MKETYANGVSKDLVSEKKEIKCSNIKNDTKMINFDDVTKENIKENNPIWPQILDYQYRKLVIGGSGSGKMKFIIIKSNKSATRYW